jgi:nucleoside-diphosphate-sugar epimerase
MSIFVVGGTGTLGRPVVRQLVAAGFEVRGLARSSANLSQLRDLGAEPVRADLFDAAQMERALRGCKRVLHLATKIPPVREATRKAAWAENDRIRTRGTRVLVDSALAAGVTAFIYPSVCLTYPDQGAAWIDTDTELQPGTGMLLSTVAAEKEVSRFSTMGGRGVVLRMGAFYGPDAPNTADALAMTRRGLAMVVGSREAYMSQIWVEDAASAVVVASEKAPAGVYNVVDNEPLTRSEVATLLASTAGRTKLFVPPGWLARVVGGRAMEPLTRSQRVTNRGFRDATGWAPGMANARVGLSRIREASEP